MTFEHNSSSLGRQRSMASAENNTSGPIPQCSKTFDRSRSSLGLHVQASVVNVKWCLLKITLQAPSDLAPQRQEMSVENVSSGLVPQGQKASDYDNSTKCCSYSKEDRFVTTRVGISLQSFT
ncbi:hypothetical protein Tco_0207513 [Tanacetum coccineum]